MSSHKLDELLAPLRDEAEPPRRLTVDRERIVSRMVEASLAPDERSSWRAAPRGRWVGGLALAASLALAAWGGSALLRGGGSGDRSLEVVALRGNVTGAQGALGVGQLLHVAASGTLQTSKGGAARIKTSAGLELELREETKVSLAELDATDNASALRLERGRVRCVVEHRPERTFEVVTPGVRVIDVGTVFDVTVADGAAGPVTTVNVEEGAVLVQHASGQAQLKASQTWTSAAAPASVPANEVTPPIATIDQLEPEPKERRDTAKRRPATLAVETELLQNGLRSEQRGDLRAAASAFETLVARYPSSPLAQDAKAALARVRTRLKSSP